MVELVDAQAWGVCGHYVHPGSSPGNGNLNIIKKSQNLTNTSKRSLTNKQNQAYLNYFYFYSRKD